MADLLEVSLLGSPQIMIAKRPVSGFITRKAQALFIYLAYSGRVHSRDTLANLFWEDLPTAQARKNLRDILPSLRQEVGPYLTITRDSVAFDRTSPYWLDVEVFRTSLETTEAAIPLELLQRSIELYKGEFLEGYHVRDAPRFEEWMVLERENLHELVLQTLFLLVERHKERRDYGAGLTVTQRILALEPWSEQAHHQRMLLLTLSGRIREALAQYDVCCRVLAEELGVTPLAETTALYHQILNGNLDKTITWKEEEENSAEKAIPLQVPRHPLPLIPPHNLPRQLTQFIGREMEVNALHAKVLTPSCFWLTIVGEGGIGKTRLALAVAESLLTHFRDGVWFVSLLDVTVGEENQEQFATVVAKVLQFTFFGSTSLTRQLWDYLRDKQLLLILDNFEHLGAGGGQFIFDLLRETQHVKVVVTSRHRLNYQAEQLFYLDGLPTPEIEEAEELTIPQLLDYAAIALFVERASRLLSDFCLTETNRTGVIQICQLLQGLPLGIELAATLVEYHACEEIPKLIEQNYAILETTLHGLPARHRNIRSVIAYSWHFLPPTEALLLAQCAVFRGGFTAESAQAITGATPALLYKLVDHSFLRQIREVSGGDRFGMHELVRQYAQEQLALTPEIERQTYHEHCNYFIDFLQAQEHKLALNIRARDAIQTELGNLCLAWDWALAHHAWATLLRAIRPLAHFFTVIGSLREATTIFATTIATLRPQLTPSAKPTADVQRLFGHVLLEKAYCCIHLAQIDRATALIQEALQVAQTTQDATLETLSHIRFGDLAWVRGDYLCHRTAYEQALSLARASGQQQTEAHCLSNLGMNHDLHRQYDRAIACYQEALTLARQMNDLQQENVICNNLGVSSALLNDFTQAIQYYYQTLRLSRLLGDREGRGFAYLNLGILFDRLGSWQQAETHTARALKIFRMLRQRRLEARALATQALINHHQGDNQRALAQAQRALQLARKSGFQAVQAEALLALGHILAERRQGMEAVQAYTEAQRLWQGLGQTHRVLLAQSGLADVLLMMQNTAGALEIVETILNQLNLEKGAPTLTSVAVFLTCYRTLFAYNDPRTNRLLSAAVERLHASIAKVPAELRHSFLENIAAHREIRRLAQQQMSLENEQ